MTCDSKINLQQIVHGCFTHLDILYISFQDKFEDVKVMIRNRKSKMTDNTIAKRKRTE